MKHIVLAIIIAIISTSLLHAKTVSYLKILGKENEVLSEWKIIEDNHSKIISGNTLLDHVFVKTINGSTVIWKNSRKKDDFKFTAIRNNNSITITGTKNNKPFTKTITVTDDPWYQTPGFLLEPFALSQQNTLQFFMLRTTSLSPVLLEINKTGTETLTLNNITYSSIKTELYPASFLKHFWKAPMWFDQKTGKILKYDSLIGNSGSDSFQIIYSK